MQMRFESDLRALYYRACLRIVCFVFSWLLFAFCLVYFFSIQFSVVIVYFQSLSVSVVHFQSQNRLVHSLE